MITRITSSALSSFERMKISLEKNKKDDIINIVFNKSLVAIAKRSHPFPSRTRKLSFSAPMVVRGCPLCESRTSLGFNKWRISSAGRASALQAEGRRFDPVILHHQYAGLAQLVEDFKRLQLRSVTSLNGKLLKSATKTAGLWRTVISSI